MYDFFVLDKSQKEIWLPRLFDLFYANMSVITPNGKSYDEQKTDWMTELLPAIDKAPRKIILAFIDGDLAGYLQYYTKDDLLMIEELQINEKYQRTRLCYRLLKHMIGILPDRITTVEAYSHKSNQNSRSIMKNMGMQEFDEEGHFVHMRGYAQYIKEKKLSRH